MKILFSRRARTLAVALALCAGVAAADTLYLRNGRRVEGRLTGVSGNQIEFESTGWNQRVERFDRADVERIEIQGGRYDRDDQRGDYDRDRDHGGGYSPGGRPSGMRQRTVSVSARNPWTSVGVDVRRGQEVYFEARGKVHWGKDRNDGPAGENHSPRNAGRPIPDRPAAALIGRVNNEDPFFIGNDSGPVRMRSSGPLQLGVNDDYLADNNGSFQVTLYY
jgi:hypothetical protein